MNISHFDDLLTAARLEIEPQRLLLVFAGVELPDDCTAEQREGFEAGNGGAMVPLMYTDKLPGEVFDFAALVAESDHFELGRNWRLVFATALSGSPSRAPSTEDAAAPLQRMVEAIRCGQRGQFIPFDRQGQPVRVR